MFTDYFWTGMLHRLQKAIAFQYLAMALATQKIKYLRPHWAWASTNGEGVVFPTFESGRDCTPPHPTFFTEPE